MLSWGLLFRPPVKQHKKPKEHQSSQLDQMLWSFSGFATLCAHGGLVYVNDLTFMIQTGPNFTFQAELIQQNHQVPF